VSEGGGLFETIGMCDSCLVGVVVGGWVVWAHAVTKCIVQGHCNISRIHTHLRLQLTSYTAGPKLY